MLNSFPRLGGKRKMPRGENSSRGMRFREGEGRGLAAPFLVLDYFFA